MPPRAPRFPALHRSLPPPLRLPCRALFTALALLAVFAAPALATLTLHDTGHWTTTRQWAGTAVHMALLPSDTSAWHSKVIWWYGLGQEYAQTDYYGGLWGWNPIDTTSAIWPQASFDSIPLAKPTGAKIFCGAITQTDSGKLFVAGGTQPGTENGMKHAWTFDPKTDTWAQTDSMSWRRWYPSATTLHNGKVLVTSGSVGLDFQMFGRLIGAESAPTDSFLLRVGVWGNGVLEKTVETSTTPRWPSPRVRHAGAWSFGTSALHMFGGENAQGYHNDMWLMRRRPHELDSDYDYTWEKLAPAEPSNQWPDERVEAVVATDSSVRSVIFGGMKKNNLGQDVALDDAWLRWKDTTELPRWHWKQLDIDDTEGSPGARAGATGFLHWPSRRMLIFGGRSTPSGAPDDSSVWAIAFDDTLGNPRWKHLSITGPSPRVGHALSFDATRTDRAFLFGGEDQHGTLKNDLWRLNINPTADTLSWTHITYLAGAPPPARRGHSMVQNSDERLYIFGGRTGSGVVDDTVYAAQLEATFYPDSGRTWIREAAQLPARTGQLAVFNGAGPFERVPELYTPAAATGSHWDTLASAPHLEEWYPQTFSVGIDSVFVSGPDTQSYYFKATTSSPAWTAFPTTVSGFKGGDAVLYRPGKVMKCGSRDDPTAVGTTKWIDLRASSPAWTASSNEMIPRCFHKIGRAS